MLNPQNCSRVYTVFNTITFLIKLQEKNKTLDFFKGRLPEGRIRLPD